MSEELTAERRAEWLDEAHLDAANRPTFSEAVLAYEAALSAREGEVERMDAALKEASTLLGIMIASPFWKEAIDPVRLDVERVYAHVGSARAALSPKGGADTLQRAVADHVDAMKRDVLPAIEAEAEQQREVAARLRHPRGGTP